MKKRITGQQAQLAAIKTVNFVIDLLLLAIVLVIAYSVYTLFESQQIYSAADALHYETYKPEPEEEDSPSFAELRRINSEVIGWLTVYGTGIDYPFLYSEVPSKYLNMDPEGNFSLAGSLYLDVDNHPDLSDPRNILYGHHMEKGRMFGDLDQFGEQDYFDSHQYGNLYYNGRNHGIAFFAYIEGDAYDQNLYGLEHDNAAFLSYAREHAVFWRDQVARPEDQLLLLSTCASGVSNERYIVAGVLSDQTYADPFPEDTADWGILRDDVLGMPVWIWLVIALLILTLLFLLLCRRRRKKRPGRRR